MRREGWSAGLLACLPLLCACSEDPSTRGVCRDVTGIEASDELAALVELGDDVVLVRQEVEAESAYAEAVSVRSVGELVQSLAVALERDGWTVLQVDNEGFEAEIFTSRADGAAGVVVMKESRCPDETLVTVTFDLGPPAEPGDTA
jgi:hypothetical protein